jgi:hypothetical protein
MLPATSEVEKERFHTLNRATGNRVHARYVDAETGDAPLWVEHDGVPGLRCRSRAMAGEALKNWIGSQKLQKAVLAVSRPIEVRLGRSSAL